MPKRGTKVRNIIILTLCMLVLMIMLFALRSFLSVRVLPVSETLRFLNETAMYVTVIYMTNLEYLWTSIIISVEVFFFSSILVSLVSSKNLKEVKKWNVSPRYNRILCFLTILVRHFITIINDLRRTYIYAFLDKKPSERSVNLNYHYLLTCLILGIVLSILILVSYEYSATLMWIIFSFYLFIVMSILVVISNIGVLEERFKDVVGISCEREEEVRVKDGSITLRIEERVIALGLSIGTGIAGIITTIGAILIKPSLVFTIIPATFDMLSLIFALTEFIGLKRITEGLSNLKNIGVGLLNLLPTISWSIYIGGVLYFLFQELRWKLPVDLILTIIASVWVSISVFSGAFSAHFKYSLTSIAKRIILFLLPFLLLLITIS